MEGAIYIRGRRQTSQNLVSKKQSRELQVHNQGWDASSALIEKSDCQYR